jgi:hypothetical protein
MSDESDLVVEKVLNEEWSLLLRQFNDFNYRQLADYSAAAAARFGACSENLAIRNAGELLGLCNVRIKKIPFLSFGIVYINGAPLVLQPGVSNEESNAILMRCLHALQIEFVGRRGYVLRVVGVARADSKADDIHRVFQSAGFITSKAKGRYRTMVVDLMRTLTEIRAELNQMWRRNLSKAQRQGLEIVRGTNVSLFQEYSELHQNLVSRKDLKIDLGPDFFMHIQERLSESERFVVHLARLDGKVVAGHIGAYHGDTAVFLLGATNEAGLKSNASYLLHWRVIEYAKELGYNWYDLGGIDPETNPGVYNFKERIGGVDICAPGPYESGSGFRCRLVQSLESLYRMLSSATHRKK